MSDWSPLGAIAAEQRVAERELTDADRFVHQRRVMIPRYGASPPGRSRSVVGGDTERSTPAAASTPSESVVLPVVPRTGSLVGNVYRILGPIGGGAMGIVLVAEDQSLDRKVAIKFVRGDRLDGGFRERFMMEARALARVSHPNVLQIHAFGVHGVAPYFVMEFVDGITLEEWIRRRNTVDLDRAFQMIGRVCAGVAAIHAADTVHRDVKPSNILVGEDDHPWVADLGLAVFRHFVGRPGRQVVGTPAYMAPEVAFPREAEAAIDERADVYSLACIAYELVTGFRPFTAHGSVAMMLEHANAKVPPPSSIRPGLSRQLDDAILRGLAKTPGDRTPTVVALAAALEAARVGMEEPVRILMVDDNDVFRELLQSALGSAFPHATLECVADGRKALEAFDGARPSIVILDLRLPGLDGFELTRRFRERDPGASVPIIVVTGAGGPVEWALLSSMGADRLLLKPVALDDVVALVQRLVSARSKGLSAA